MAIGGAIANNPTTTGQIVNTSSVRGEWVIANDDASSVNSAAELLSPGTINDATFHWVKVGPGCTRIIIRARIGVAATVTTKPIVRVVGAYGPINAGDGSAMPTDGTARFLRLDNVDSATAGMTLDIVSSAVGQMQDATYAYCDPMPSLDGIDLKGAHYVGVLIETAGAVSAGAIAVEVLMLN